MPAAACAYARDLPLIALMGANTVRTYALLPEGDRTFTSVLDSTGLFWLAGFPSQGTEQETLVAFRNYARRFRREKNLIGYVFERKSSTGTREFHSLLESAATILRELEPERTPALAAETSAADDLRQDIRGLSFWVWSGQAQPEGASLPVLLSGGVAADFLGDGGLFRANASPQGLDTLTPTSLYYRMAGLWGGTFPSGWSEKQAPTLGTTAMATSPGALLRLGGNALAAATVPYADETWPFHLAGSCVCVDGAPARLSFLAPRIVTFQIPPEAHPGLRTVVFFRGGQASNTSTIEIGELPTVVYSGPVLEAASREH